MASSRSDISSLHASTTEIIARVATLGVALDEGFNMQTPTAGQGRPLEEFWAKQRSISDRHRDLNCTAAVLAQAKSGKSTFINAVVGAPLLPVNNVPETARLCRLKHNPQMQEPVLHGTATGTVVGEDAICKMIKDLNTEVRTRRKSSIKDEQELDIEVSIAALQGSSFSVQNGMSFSLLDTPGPNEAGEEKLKHAVERLLDGIDAVIYVLDFTKLKTSSEAMLFQQLKSINPQLVRRLSERLHFVVNKNDSQYVCEGMDSKATQEYVASLLNSQMNLESFHMEPSQVLLVSARDAFLARMVLRGQPLEASTISQFKEIAFGQSSRRKTVSEQQMRDAAEEMLEGSGVPELEARVLVFLTSNAAAIKLCAILDDVTNLLHLVGNGVAASTAALETDVAKLQNDAAAMQIKLSATLDRFNEAKNGCGAIEKEVVDEVRERLGALKKKLETRISEVLDEAATAPPSSSTWGRVWKKASSLLKQQEATKEPESLQKKFTELHTVVFASVDDEVRAFWHELEVSANGHQEVLLGRLNTHLAEITQEIEAVVGEALAIELQPVAISLPLPSAQDFHETLAELFAQGVKKRTEIKQERRAMSDTSWGQRKNWGLCGTGHYFEPNSEHKFMPVMEDREETVYQVAPEKVRRLLTNLVGEVVDTSVRATRAFVRQYMADTIADAQHRIELYATRYTDNMTGALNTCKMGQEARQAALEASRTLGATVKELLSDAAALQLRTIDLRATRSLAGDPSANGSAMGPDAVAAAAPEDMNPIEQEDAFLVVPLPVG